MNLKELTLDREGLAAAIACEDAAFEAAVKYNLYDRKTSLPDGPMSVEAMDGRKVVIGYGRWGDSKHFHRG